MYCSSRPVQKLYSIFVNYLGTIDVMDNKYIMDFSKLKRFPTKEKLGKYKNTKTL
jgi:hypothetical protein